MAESLIARFDVNGWEPRDLDGLDPGWVGAVTMKKQFTAGIVGSSTALFVSSGDVEGQRSYLAAERITGTLDGRGEGSVTVHHGGVEPAPEAAFGHVVAHTGTGAFEGWAGSVRIEHDDAGAYFVIDLTS